MTPVLTDDVRREVITIVAHGHPIRYMVERAGSDDYVSVEYSKQLPPTWARAYQGIDFAPLCVVTDYGVWTPSGDEFVPSSPSAEKAVAAVRAMRDLS